MENDSQPNLQFGSEISQQPNQLRVSKNWSKILAFTSLGLLTVLGVGWFSFQLGKSQGRSEQLEATSTTDLSETITSPTTDELPSPTLDPSSNWKNYLSPTHEFLFSYPPSWTLDTKTETEEFNAGVRLSDGVATIQIYANMDGIGGNGQDYIGTRVLVGDKVLYKYRSTNTQAQTQQIGLTDERTNSLGLFKVGKETYGIFLTLPMNGLSVDQVKDYEAIFDELLSNFEFELRAG